MDRCEPNFKADMKKFHVQGYGQVKMGEGLSQYTINTPLLVTIGICSADDKQYLRQEGFSSFPSGHVAFVFGCNMYVAMWLARQYDFGAGRKRRSLDESQISQGKRAKLWRILYSIIRVLVISSPGRPSILALFQIMFGLGMSIWVANSRYRDNRHHVFDIVISAIYGTMIGWLGFKLFQPAGLGVAPESDEKAVSNDVDLQHGKRGHTWA